MRRLILGFVLTLSATAAAAQGIPIKSGSTSDLASVNTHGSILTTEGESDSATYEVSLSTVSYTAVESLINLEAEASRGFRISQLCINPGWATAVAMTQWQLIRTTTASSAGTVISAEGTTTHSVTKMDPGDSNWSGVARTGGTEGTSGAVLDQGTIFVPTLTTPPTVVGWQCREYGMNGGKLPEVAAGTANGVKLMFTATAGGAAQSAMIRFIAVP